MGNSTPAGVVQLCSYITKQRTSTYCGLPGRVVHAEVLKVHHVDGDSSVSAAQACYGKLVCRHPRRGTLGNKE